MSDQGPGLRRSRAGNGFHYFGVSGKRITSPRQIKRLRALVIPPAWREVWICPEPHGHIQVTGLDDRGRKQYLYHPEWRAVRDQTKFDRMVQFGRALPRIRREVSRLLRRPGLERDKVLAAAVAVLDRTGIRVGNDEYARDNNSFGLTTLRDRHVDIRGAKVSFEFRGKSGVMHARTLHDRRLARIIGDCQDLPGYELFQYLDEQGQRQSISSQDVNDFLRRISGQDFTAKDFRTWAGTLYATIALCACGNGASERQLKKNVVQAVKETAHRLGNTPATCRKYYVHPAITESYLCGNLLASLPASQGTPGLGHRQGLGPLERAVLRMLRRGRHSA